VNRPLLHQTRENRRKILFASLGSLGDLHPLLALAEEVQRRGHEVRLAASECFRSRVLAAGFCFHPIRPDLDPAHSDHLRFTHPVAGPGRLLRERIFPSSEETALDLLEAARDVDLLVVGELIYVASLVSQKLKLPWVNVVLSPSSFLSTSDPCLLAPVQWISRSGFFRQPLHRATLSLGRRVTHGWARPLRRLHRQWGIPLSGNPVYEGKHSPFLTLAAFPSCLASRQPDWPARVIQTGYPYCTTTEAFGESHKRWLAFRAAGDPPVVFTLGSTAVHLAGDFYSTASEAAREAGFRSLLLVGENPPPLPAHDCLALPYLPLGSALEGAAAVVHHGGMGSCAEALRNGIPSLILPFGYDQPDNAARMARIGAAKVLPGPPVHRNSLVANLRALRAGSGLARKCQDLRTSIDPPGDRKRSVDFLLSVGEVPPFSSGVL